MSNEIKIVQVHANGKLNEIAGAVYIPYRGMVISVAVGTHPETAVFHTMDPNDRNQLFTTNGATTDSINAAMYAIDQIVDRVEEEQDNQLEDIDDLDEGADAFGYDGELEDDLEDDYRADINQ